MYVHTRGEDEIFEGFNARPAEQRIEDMITEAELNQAIGDMAEKQTRAAGMSIALAWIEDGDFSFDALDLLCVGVADVDIDEDISDEEEPYYNELLEAAAEALVSLGAAPGNVASFIDDEDPAEGAKIGDFLKEKLDSEARDEEELIAAFAVNESLVAESAVKVVRDGQLKLIKKRIRRPRKLTAAQRMALAKARRKAHTGVANLARRKSLRIRRKRGL